jgi:hypothetical protein
MIISDPDRQKVSDPDPQHCYSPDFVGICVQCFEGTVRQEFFFWGEGGEVR